MRRFRNGQKAVKDVYHFCPVRGSRNEKLILFVQKVNKANFYFLAWVIRGISGLSKGTVETTLNEDLNLKETDENVSQIRIMKNREIAR